MRGRITKATALICFALFAIASAPLLNNTDLSVTAFNAFAEEGASSELPPTILESAERRIDDLYAELAKLYADRAVDTEFLDRLKEVPHEERDNEVYNEHVDQVRIRTKKLLRKKSKLRVLKGVSKNYGRELS